VRLWSRLSQWGTLIRISFLAVVDYFVKPIQQATKLRDLFAGDSRQRVAIHHFHGGMARKECLLPKLRTMRRHCIQPLRKWYDLDRRGLVRAVAAFLPFSHDRHLVILVSLRGLRIDQVAKILVDMDGCPGRLSLRLFDPLFCPSL